jgi:hypothetical protein
MARESRSPVQVLIVVVPLESPYGALSERRHPEKPLTGLAGNPGMRALV